MNTQATSFQTVLDSLLDTKKEFPRRYLAQFSDIGTLELKTLLDVWDRVGLSRKLSLLEGLESLAETDTLVSFDDLARALLTDPEPSVRTHAIRLLDECEDAKLIPAYLDLLRNDPDSNVRAEAATALNLFVDLGELEEISEEAYGQVHAALMESAVGEKETRVRRHALESLGFSSRPEVVPLIESAFNRENPEWKASALVAMGRSADERWDDVVLGALLSENDNVRKTAVEAAGALSLKLARPVLLRMLLEEEEDDEVINAAIWSLSQIGGEDVRTYLENLLDQTEDEEQIEFLEDALDNLAFTEDLDRFELMAFDPDELDDLDDLEELEDFDEEGEEG
jgi:HEAT repeat protein